MQSSNTVILQSMAQCTLYKASLESGFELTKEFQSDVEKMPLDDEDEKRYVDFINNYGTHFVNVLVMGAKAIVQNYFEKSALESLKKTGLNVDAAAEASFKTILSIGVSNSVTSNNKDQEHFQSKREHCKTSFLGSRPPADGELKTWSETTGKSPYPVFYELKEITWLFEPDFFPNLNSNDLKMKKNRLLEVYSKHCSTLPKCVESNKVPVRFDKKETTIHKENTLKCIPGYNLLFCGMKNIYLGNSHLYNYPENNECKINSGDEKNEFSVWCASGLKNAKTVIGEDCYPTEKIK